MEETLGSFLSIYRFPNGRREFAFGGLVTLAREAGWTELTDHCTTAIALEKELRNQRRELASAKGMPANPRLTELDPQIDRLVGAVYRIASEPITTIPRSAQATHGRAIVQRALPGGAVAVTTRNYVEQSTEITSIITLLEGELAPHVAALYLGDYVAELKRLNEEFCTILSDRPRGQVTADRVRALDEEGQDNLLQAIVMVAARFRTRQTADVTSRAAFLAPVIGQNRAIYEYLRL